MYFGNVFMRGFLHIFLLWREDKPVGLIMKTNPEEIASIQPRPSLCWGKNTAALVTNPWRVMVFFLPMVMNIRGKKEGDDSPVALLPFAASTLECHKRHCSLQCSCECSCGCPRLDLCLLLQPSITLIPPGHAGLWASTCCRLPTFSATAHAEISIQTTITVCDSSWTSLAVHGEHCYACSDSSCGLGLCHCFYPVLKRYETRSAWRCKKAVAVSCCFMDWVMSLRGPLVLRGSVKSKLK